MGNDAKGDGEGADIGGLQTHERLDPVQLVPADHVYRRWFAVVAADTPPERVMDPTFLTRCMDKLTGAAFHQPPDRIEIMPADRAWFAELFVVSLGAEEVEVVGRVTPLPDRRTLRGKRRPLGQNVGDFEYRDGGPVDGWSVVRTHDGHVMKKNLHKGQCAAWLGDYLRTVGK